MPRQRPLQDRPDLRAEGRLRLQQRSDPVLKENVVAIQVVDVGAPGLRPADQVGRRKPSQRVVGGLDRDPCGARDLPPGEPHARRVETPQNRDMARSPEHCIERPADILPVSLGERTYHECLEYTIYVYYSRRSNPGSKGMPDPGSHAGRPGEYLDREEALTPR